MQKGHTMTKDQFTKLHPDFYSHLTRTPLRIGSKNTGTAQIDFKDETTHESGSFKDRGALNFLLQAYTDNPGRLATDGVVTASAGNHGQGVARAARRLGVPAHVFVPNSTPQSKVVAIRQYGAYVTRVAGTVDEALSSAQTFAFEMSAVFVHPFDDMSVIAGQATVGHEIIAQTIDQHPDKVFVPVGGGGLLTGVCSAVDASGYKTAVIGVQLKGADAFTQSLSRNYDVTLQTVNTLSDGTAVKTAGSLALSYVRGSASFGKMIVVTEAQLGSAMQELDRLVDTKVEPAGALAYAGVMKLSQMGEGYNERWVAILSGNHRDTTRYSALQNAAHATCG